MQSIDVLFKESCNFDDVVKTTNLFISWVNVKFDQNTDKMCIILKNNYNILASYSKLYCILKL